MKWGMLMSPSHEYKELFSSMAGLLVLGELLTVCIRFVVCVWFGILLSTCDHLQRLKLGCCLFPQSIQNVLM